MPKIHKTYSEPVRMQWKGWQWKLVVKAAEKTNTENPTAYIRKAIDYYVNKYAEENFTKQEVEILLKDDLPIRWESFK